MLHVSGAPLQPDVELVRFTIVGGLDGLGELPFTETSVIETDCAFEETVMLRLFNAGVGVGTTKTNATSADADAAGIGVAPGGGGV